MMEVVGGPKSDMKHNDSELSMDMGRHDCKVSVVGCGRVGTVCAYTIMQQNIAREISLVDVSEERLLGEQMDLQQGLPFTKPCDIHASTDFSVTADSEVCIITAGLAANEGESYEKTVMRNVDLFKKIVPQLVRYSPDTILLVISRPVDILSYVAWKLSGLPKERVIGLGTNVDSGCFKFLIAESLQIAPNSCHGWIIGEQGEASIPVWSSVNVAGVKLEDNLPGNFAEDEHWQYELHSKVMESAKEILRLKGYVSWAVGLSTACLLRSILRDGNDSHAVSVNVKGLHGIEEDVFLSLPCIIGADGVRHVIKQHLTERETLYLRKSAARLLETQKSLHL